MHNHINVVVYPAGKIFRTLEPRTDVPPLINLLKNPPRISLFQCIIFESVILLNSKYRERIMFFTSLSTIEISCETHNQVILLEKFSTHPSYSNHSVY